MVLILKLYFFRLRSEVLPYFFQDKLNNIEREEPSSATSSVRDDALSKVLGKDRPGRLRAKGRGATITKLSYLAARDNHVSQLKEEHSNMRNRVNQLESLVHKLMGAQVYILSLNFFTVKAIVLKMELVCNVDLRNCN